MIFHIFIAEQYFLLNILQVLGGGEEIALLSILQKPLKIFQIFFWILEDKFNGGGENGGSLFTMYVYRWLSPI